MPCAQRLQTVLVLEQQPSEQQLRPAIFSLSGTHHAGAAVVQCAVHVKHPDVGSGTALKGRPSAASAAHPANARDARERFLAPTLVDIFIACLFVSLQINFTM